MDISLQELAEKLKVSDEYRIVYHIRPDGDCIGSAFALALELQSIGKKCEVVGQDSIPRIHQYMTDQVAMDILKNPVWIGMTIRELPDGRMRCSIRTNGNISADAICREHGGGEHFHAACCELSTDARTARKMMEETYRKYLLAEIKK